ncbi:YrdB family protein [Bacillus sp. FJAT-49732]|uniref:YrdB family protein n=1 Tax=Lederbergia citrisecunda TaxID=2833583 RepID=A0A942TRU4_9BACI|nr:YrdB family protein [Lederbergia citrisecunda]MBS4201084.1 YrdB family protein [Lederbergia citrisecunda]
MIAFQYTVFIIFFLMELCALAAFSYWGFQIERGWVVKIFLGIGVPLFVAIFWGTFLAPKASFPVPTYARILLQLLIFTLACVALYVSNKGKLAIIFGTVVVIEMILMYFLDKGETF